jgi:hypothetical protein
MTKSTAKATDKRPSRVTKQDQIASLLLRDEGATLDQMVAATGWLPHTTRAALTGLRKKGSRSRLARVHDAEYSASAILLMSIFPHFWPA